MLPRLVAQLAEGFRNQSPLKPAGCPLLAPTFSWAK